MAIPRVTIQGPVVAADGEPIGSGTVVVMLSQPGSVVDPDTGTAYIVAPTQIAIGPDGQVPANTYLVPNDQITPSGTYYFARYTRLRTHEQTSVRIPQEMWQLASTPNPIDFGSIPRLGIVPGTEQLALPVSQAQGGTGASSLGDATLTPTGGSNPRALDDVAAATLAYDFLCYFAGSPTDSEVLARVVVTRAITLPADLTGSRGYVGTNPTASASIDLQRNGVSVGTITIATDGTVAFAAAAAVSLASGDRLSFHAQAVADATLADISITLAGSL